MIQMGRRTKLILVFNAYTFCSPPPCCFLNLLLSGIILIILELEHVHNSLADSKILKSVCGGIKETLKLLQQTLKSYEACQGVLDSFGLVLKKHKRLRES